jgi:hypothetical protein
MRYRLFCRADEPAQTSIFYCIRPEKSIVQPIFAAAEDYFRPSARRLAVRAPGTAR